MTAVAPSAIADDLVTIINQTLKFTNAMYGPPEQMPHAELSAWVDYGPVDWEWGLLGVSDPEIVITIVTPSNSHYPEEYRLVTDKAHAVVQALRNQRQPDGIVELGGEAVIVGVRQERAGRIAFAGDPGALMACAITLRVETKQE